MTTLPGEGPPGAGRRGNGLSAAEWGALVDLDPRLSGVLLDSLAAEGVAAFVEPAAGVDTVSRAVSLPKRPLDRLWVDPARADRARVVVTAEVADLSALLAEDEPGATAHGLVRPVPRTAATRVLAPPQLPGPPRRTGPDHAGSTPVPLDDDEVFRQIIAGFSDEIASAVPPWPVEEDLPRATPPRRRTEPGPPTRRHTDSPQDGHPAGAHPDARPPGAQSPGAQSPDARPPGAQPPGAQPPGAQPPGAQPPGAQPPGALPGWLEPERIEDDGHFVPPPPPAVPRVRLRTVGAVVMLLLGLVLLFAPGLVGQVSGAGILLLGIALMAGGAGLLVWWVRDAPDDDSGPDHGAVV